MPSHPYVYFHSSSSVIGRRIKQGFSRAWTGIDGIELALTHQLKAEFLQQPDCRAVAAFAADKKSQEVLKKIPGPVWNYSHRLESMKSARNIFVDDQEVGVLAAQYFLGKGYRNFGFLTDEKNAYSKHRLAGFQGHLATQGQSVQTLVCHPEESMNPPEFNDYRQNALRAWLQKLPPPAAILASNDSVAILLIRHLQQNAPDLLPLYAVVGVDNSFSAEDDEPLPFSITSIEPNFPAVGAAIAEEIRTYLSAGTFHPGTTRVITGTRLIERESTHGVSREDPFVARLMRQILQQVEAGEAPRVNDLSRRFGTTPRTLLSRFSSVTGQSLRDFILDERLGRAARLLLDGKGNIADIAYACGFSKQGDLSENFHRHYGCTPRDFLARHKKSILPMQTKG